MYELIHNPFDLSIRKNLSKLKITLSSAMTFKFDYSAYYFKNFYITLKQSQPEFNSKSCLGSDTLNVD